MNFLKSFIGAGILGLPYAFKKAGLAGGTFGLMIVALFVNYGIKKLVKVKRHLQQDVARVGKHISFVDVGREVLGRSFEVAIMVSLLFTQLGICVAYIIFSAKSMLFIFGKDLSFYTAVPFVLIVPCLLVMIRNMRRLTIVSAFGNATMIGTIAFIIVISRKDERLEHNLVVHEGVLPSLPIFIGIATFAMEGIVNAISIDDALCEPGSFTKVTNMCFMTVFVLYMSFGLSCYLCFGQYTQDVITLNLDGAEGAIVKISLSFVLLTTYPLQMFPVTCLTDEWLIQRQSASHTEQPSLYVQGCIVRLALVLLTGVVAVVLPSFGMILSLLGCVCFSFLGFVVPSLAHLKLFGSQLSNRRKFFDYCVLAFAAVSLVGGLLANAIDILPELKPLSAKFEAFEKEVKAG